MPSAVISFLFLALPAIAWGGMFHVAMRVLPSIDPYWLTFLRYGPSALCLYALMRWREPAGAAMPAGAGRAVIIAGTIGFGLFNFALYTGLTMTTPEHGAIIMAMTPLLGALLSWGIDRRLPAPATLASIAIALAGTVLVVTGREVAGDGHASSLSGDLLALVGATSWAFYQRTVGWFPGWSSLRFSALSTSTGALAIGVGVAVFSLLGWTQVPEGAAVMALGPELFYLVFVGTLFSLILWNLGIARVGPVNGALFMNLVPVSALIIGMAIGHRPAVSELAGAILVIVALLANNLLQRRARLAALRVITGAKSHG